MRLIDADALRKRLLDLDGPARSPVLLLDAAPTVCCAECVDYRVSYCIFKDGLRVDTDACFDLFERRTP